MQQYQKIKAPAKRVVPAGEELTRVSLDTMRTISEMVGVTLGPGGRPVLMEVYEYDAPIVVTKDGVTVFRSLGFADPVKQAITECFRDSSARTAASAGDGTTTAAVLGAELYVRLHAFCKKNPRVSPQKVVRELERLFAEAVEPSLLGVTRKHGLSDEADRKTLEAVARMSANGDCPLARAVMECYDVCGDAGHVTITELGGPSRYEVEAVEGFPVQGGYEDHCGPFYPKFVNDNGRQICSLEKPLFVLYHGEINDVYTMQGVLEVVGNAVLAKETDHVSVVVAAVRFSEQVLGMMAANMAAPDSLNPYPLVVPRSPFSNGQKQFLDDLSAVTGATVFDPINRPLGRAQLADFGPGVDRFESSRWKSIVLGIADPDAVLVRVAELQVLASKPESEMDLHFTNERIGRLTGGIAKLKVFGGSNAETREKRDRAEDAVCSVRCAIKSGTLPGGGWGLLRAARAVEVSAGTGDMEAVAREVMAPALRRPAQRILENCGYSSSEVQGILAEVEEEAVRGRAQTYDALEGAHVDAYAAGVLDSLPAVLEAVRNGISSAARIGTCGGVVVFERDRELERREAHEAEAWKRDAAEDSPADQRA